MKLSRLWNAAAGAVLLSFAVSSHAADLAPSGTVLGTDGKPLAGVTVSLALARTMIVTDAAGAWSLVGAPVGISAQDVVPVANGRLMLEGGRLSVRFDGRDISGRGTGHAAMTRRLSTVAARVTDVPDTLLYTWNGKVRLRDTISVARTGIVRTLDTTLNPSIVHGYLTDERDGQTYRTVKIGSQVWMAQNLNYKVDSSWVYKCQTLQANCLADSVAMGSKYGRLYKWAAAMGLEDTCNRTLCASQVAAKHRGVCPVGWHVPRDPEWTKLTDTTLAAATAGTKLKANSSLWSTNTGTDDYGFSVLPAGIRSYNYPPFQNLGAVGEFWSASEISSAFEWYRYFYGSFEVVGRSSDYKAFGYSLRCLQD